MSLKTEYACRVLAQLAKRHTQERPTHVEALAQLEEVPANYLVQILNELRTSGIIGSRRGKQGGYFLAKDPDDITLSDILRALDGDMLDFRVQHRGESGEQVATAWGEISRSLRSQTEKVSLRSIIASNQQSMYYI